MFATFDGTLKENLLDIPELGETISSLFGKSVTILAREFRNGVNFITQPIFQGVIQPEIVKSIGYDGAVTIIVRQPVEIASKSTAFDEKFVLGSKIGDADN